MVLVADDDPAIRLLVSATLASDEYTVLQAADGEEAWRLIREHHPAVAILDWQMPVHDGLELTAVIKGDPQLRAITVIMLTAKTAPADRAAAAKARADLYLVKPFSTQQLRDAVEKALGLDGTRSAQPPQAADRQVRSMPSSKDERMMWLAEAQGVIRGWENQSGGAGRRLSAIHAVLLADRIATALQHADAQGRAARSS
jgi:CheY-like chemotaxis protein